MTYTTQDEQGKRLFAKKQIKAGDSIGSYLTSKGANVAAENALKNNAGKRKIRADKRNEMFAMESPNLLAKAVASSRLDQALGTHVLSKETFGKDKKTGEYIGLSHGVAGKQVASINKELGMEINNFDKDVYKNPNVQKGFANLQTMDALSGQMDRHFGNVFVDSLTGQVKGIDNDSAFHAQNKSFVPDENGEMREHNVLDNLFSRVQNSTDKDINHKRDAIKFNQKLMDRETAMNIIKMSEKEFVDTLMGEVNDPEQLTPQSIQAAVVRFHAVRRRAKELKKITDKNRHRNRDDVAGGEGLVDEFNDSTFDMLTDSKEGSTNYLGKIINEKFDKQAGQDEKIEEKKKELAEQKKPKKKGLLSAIFN